jgi:ketosteroid isomerase-like protein
MTENENTAIVRRWFEEVWNQRKLDTIDELFHPGGVAFDLGGQGATVKGPAAFREAAAHMQRVFGGINIKVEDIFGVDDRVAVRLSSRMKNTGPLGDRPPTRTEVEVPVVCRIRIRDGKIIEGWNFWDVASALRAAGAPAEQVTLF